jgi:hypothetical protein
MKKELRYEGFAVFLLKIIKAIPAGIPKPVKRFRSGPKNFLSSNAARNCASGSIQGHKQLIP